MRRGFRPAERRPAGASRSPTARRWLSRTEPVQVCAWNGLVKRGISGGCWLRVGARNERVGGACGVGQAGGAVVAEGEGTVTSAGGCCALPGRSSWRWAGSRGVSAHDGSGSAALCFAGRDRRAWMRRELPLTVTASLRVGRQRLPGDRSCSGGAPTRQVSSWPLDVTGDELGPGARRGMTDGGLAIVAVSRRWATLACRRGSPQRSSTAMSGHDAAPPIRHRSSGRAAVPTPPGGSCGRSGRPCSHARTSIQRGQLGRRQLEKGAADHAMLRARPVPASRAGPDGDQRGAISRGRGSRNWLSPWWVPAEGLEVLGRPHDGGRIGIHLVQSCRCRPQLPLLGHVLGSRRAVYGVPVRPWIPQYWRVLRHEHGGLHANSHEQRFDWL